MWPQWKHRNLVDHTKFAPDWCFGLVKQKFLVGCLDDLACVVNQSAKANHAQLVGREDGTTIAPQFDWAEFFQPHFRRGAFDGIKSWHHLRFSSAAPGQAKVRKTCNAEEETLTLLKKQHLSWKQLPNTLIPPGLTEERNSMKRSGNTSLINIRTLFVHYPQQQPLPHHCPRLHPLLIKLYFHPPKEENERSPSPSLPKSYY